MTTFAGYLDIDTRALLNFYVCSISMPFLIGTLILDIYHFDVWRHYRPSTDPNCCGRSSKHKRYIPYHIVGKDARKDIYGDRPCEADSCNNRKLGHVLLFHGADYQPQARWSRVEKLNRKGVYIGFHRTSPKAAKSITHTEFRSSERGMLGKGVYFARSIEGAKRKANDSGAYFVVEVRMRRVFVVNKLDILNRKTTETNEDLGNFVRRSGWHDQYDTCYLNHSDEKLDEFCIKDPESQIIKWIAVVEKGQDKNIESFGLDKELDSTRCGCI